MHLATVLECFGVGSWRFLIECGGKVSNFGAIQIHCGPGCTRALPVDVVTWSMHLVVR